MPAAPPGKNARTRNYERKKLVKSRVPHTQPQAMTGIVASNGARVSLRARISASMPQHPEQTRVSGVPKRVLKLGKAMARKWPPCALACLSKLAVI
jgi:hypothetical protein